MLGVWIIMLFLTPWPGFSPVSLNGSCYHILSTRWTEKSPGLGLPLKDPHFFKGLFSFGADLDSRCSKISARVGIAVVLSPRQPQTA